MNILDLLALKVLPLGGWEVPAQIWGEAWIVDVKGCYDEGLTSMGVSRGWLWCEGA